MPATSVAQRKATSIAEHHPEKLYARNKGLLKMTHQQLHDFAATSEKGLPRRVKSMARGGMVPKAGLFRLHGGEMVIPRKHAGAMHKLMLEHMLNGSFKMPKGFSGFGASPGSRIGAE